MPMVKNRGRKRITNQQDSALAAKLLSTWSLLYEFSPHLTVRCSIYYYFQSRMQMTGSIPFAKIGSDDGDDNSNFLHFTVLTELFIQFQ